GTTLEAFLAVRLIALQRTVRAYDHRRRAGALAGTVNRREVARILRRAAEHGFLVESVGGIGERHWAIAPGFGDVRVWVKHQLRTSTHSPPHGFWIAPAFVADHHAERQRPDAEQTTLGPERGIGAFLRRVALALVLPPCDGAVRIDH